MSEFDRGVGQGAGFGCGCLLFVVGLAAAGLVLLTLLAGVRG